MHIRHLTLEDFDERIALSEFAFQFKMPERRREEELAFFRPAEHIGAFDQQGRLLSALILLPLRVWVNGTSMSMGGVAGVATWPEARRHGCVSRLLHQALREMREQGQTVSMLHPFAFSFYRKYGWEMTVERKKYELEPHHFPGKSDVAGTVERIGTDTAVVSHVYAKVAARYTGTLDRTEEWWTRKRWNTPGLVAVYRNAQGEPEGYLHYQVENRVMTVLEWVAQTEDARGGLWNFVRNHDSMIDRVLMTVSADDPLPFLVADPRFKQELQPYFMSRIVDAEAFVSKYRFAAGAAEEILVRLSDVHAPWNEGMFRLIFQADGEAILIRVEEAGADSAPAAAILDTQTLTALLLGGRRPGLLSAAGRLNAERAAIDTLERRIPRYRTFLMDFF